MHSSNARFLKSFSRHQDGTIAVLFGLTVSIMAVCTGLAIDVGRVVHTQSKVAAAVDAAALAAAKNLHDSGASDDRAREVAKEFFSRNMSGTYANVKSVNVDVDHRKNSITVEADIDVKTVFAGLAGVSKFSFAKSSTAIYDSKDIEIGMQLDVTGSMNASGKLQHLKDAVAGPDGLLDILFPANGTSNRVRIGLAPYSAGVNAGPYARTVSRDRAVDGCVYERLNLNDQNKDDRPIDDLSLRARSDLIGAGNCPSGAKIVALSNNGDTLRREINRWTANGATAGHLGTAWAWYLISPQWSAVWPNSSRPADYNDGKTMKVAILMTDGIYNTVGGRSDGDFGPRASQSKSLAKGTCDAMKAKGIIIYTIGFEVPADAKPALAYCASSDSKFFDARDAEALKRAFRAIAVEVSNLRLSS